MLPQHVLIIDTSCDDRPPGPNGLGESGSQSREVVAPTHDTELDAGNLMEQALQNLEVLLPVVDATHVEDASSGSLRPVDGLEPECIRPTPEYGTIDMREGTQIVQHLARRGEHE